MNKLLALSKTELDMNYLLAGIDGGGASVLLGICIVVCVAIIFGHWLKELPSTKPKPEEDDNEDSKKSSFKMPNLSKIEFTDSHWILLYKICGWIAFLVAVILLLKGQYVNGVYFVCMGLSSFLAAHVLRLLEKGIHHLENLDKRWGIDKKGNKE